MDKALYDGWELKYFDKAFNFRNYQFEFYLDDCIELKTCSQIFHNQ